MGEVLGDGKAMKGNGFYSTLALRYEQACKEYPELLAYDKTSHDSVKGIMRGIHQGKADSGQPPSLSFHSLKRATTLLVDGNCQAATEILRYKKHISSNHQLSSIVQEHVALSTKTLGSLYNLLGCLNISTYNLMMLRRSLEGCNSPEATEEVLDKLRDAGSFANGFILTLPEVIEQHALMLKRLQTWLEKHGKEMQRQPRRRRKVVNFVFVTVFSAAVVCSVLVVALHAPPLLAALPPAISTITSWGPLASWLDGLYNGDGQAIMASLSSLEDSKKVVIQEVAGINLLTKTLRGRMNDQEGPTVVFVKEGNGDGKLHQAVSFKESFLLQGIIKTIEKRVHCLMEDINGLEEHVGKCCSDIDKPKKKIQDRLQPKRPGPSRFLICRCILSS